MPGACRILEWGVVVCALVCTAAGCSAGARTEGGQPAPTATDASLLRSRVAVHDRFVELLSRRDLQGAAELLYVPAAAPAAAADRLRARARHALRLLTIEFGQLSEPQPALRGARFYHVRFNAAGLEECPHVVGTSNVARVHFARRGAGYLRTRMCAGSNPPRVSVVAYGLPAEREGARAETVEICAALLLAMRDARSAAEARRRCEEDIPLRI